MFDGIEEDAVRDVRKFCVGVAMDALRREDMVCTAALVVEFAAEIEKFVLGDCAVDTAALQPGQIVYKRD